MNPSTFCGQRLVVLFCPSDPAAALRELEVYRSHAEAFEAAGVWLLAVLASERCKLPDDAGRHTSVAVFTDANGKAWDAFEGLLDESDRSSEEKGGTFLFARGGSLTRAWAGAGHIDEVLQELRLHS